MTTDAEKRAAKSAYDANRREKLRAEIKAAKSAYYQRTRNPVKEALWDTLNSLKAGSMQPAEGDAIASQAREILRTTNTQLKISQQSKRPVPADVIGFSEK